MEPDWEREGLLDGLSDERERAARAELLDQLHRAGVSVDELRQAVAEQRVALLPAELVLTGDGRHTIAEVAERAGVEVDFLRDELAAMGLPRPDPGERIATDEDLEVARVIARFRSAGIAADDLLDMTRVAGQSIATVSDAILQLVGRTFLRPGDTERDLGLRYAEIARELGPLMGPVLERHLRLALREGVRRVVVDRAELASGRLPGARDVAVGFADLVGFTRLGEQLAPEEIGAVAGRLAALAAERAAGPVRLIKTIGDAVMLASPDASALLEVALDLERAAEADEELPQLRVGLAYGPALARGGDWYGRPVNLASRITAIARPGSVLATTELREAVGDGYRWSRVPPRHLKGVEGRVPLFRARRLEPGGDGGGAQGGDDGDSDGGAQDSDGGDDAPAENGREA